MGVDNRIHRVNKKGCVIVSVDTATKQITGRLAGAQDVPIHAWTYGAVFRWPKVGEEWILEEQNGNWYLDSIIQGEGQTAKEAFECGKEYAKGTIVTFEGKEYMKLT